MCGWGTGSDYSRCWRRSGLAALSWCRAGSGARTNAERGMRNPEQRSPASMRSACCSAFRLPSSALVFRRMRVGVDVGGTFTDLVALAGDGAIEVRKVVSTPQDPAVGLFRAVDELGNGERGMGNGAAIDVLVHGTTIAANTVLERSGPTILM